MTPYKSQKQKELRNKSQKQKELRIKVRSKRNSNAPQRALVKLYLFIIYYLVDRERLGPGKSPEMSSLFRFWSFFLRNNFNRGVYEYFKKLALEVRTS